MKFVIYQSEKDQQWYWKLLAANGKTIADGCEGYVSKGNCRKAVIRVQSKAAGAVIVLADGA